MANVAGSGTGSPAAPLGRSEIFAQPSHWKKSTNDTDVSTGNGFADP